MKRGIFLAFALAGVVATAGLLTASGGTARVVASVQPLVGDYAQVSASETPPTEAQCFTVNFSATVPHSGRRCFTPGAIRAAYNLGPVYGNGITGKGYTIAIVDSYGSDTMAHDLNVFDTQMGLPHMCGEVDANGPIACASGMPTFSTLDLQGSPATKPQGNGKGIGLEDKTGWALEVVLDVEWAHAIAPGANILLVHTPTAETLGVQGFPQMMMAEDYVVKHHLADVISQSFGSSELAFGSAQSLLNLRDAFEDAKDNHVTVIASSGDFGSTNETKQSLTGAGADVIQTPNVGWPASDPLVTGVGGTYLCQDPNNTTARVVDSVDPPPQCPANPGIEEIGWIDSGGGFSSIFSRPDFQSSLPAGSTAFPSDSRGVPDVAYNASSRTGVLVYVSLPPAGSSGAICTSLVSNPPAPCSTGWYIIGGTSAGAPQWAGLVALADQIAGHRLGYINPALYQIANSGSYANDFYDVTVGNNVGFPPVPGYSATPGWDPVTGLGTPNAANLLPDLAAKAG
jgi:subtilase family serine protease